MPWRLVDRAGLAKTKLEVDYKNLLQGCPQSFHLFKADVETLGFFDQPHYAQILTAMRKDMNSLKVRQEDPFEWEDPAYIF